jgi:molecular chaperone DnaK (HSP70)
MLHVYLYIINYWRKYELLFHFCYNFFLGGTADITVHHRQDDDTLEEVVPASGGPWGGITIDAAYLKFLEMLFSKEVIEIFKNGDLYDYTELIQQFEVKKRSITSEQDTDVVITMPMGLLEIIKSKLGGVEKAIKRSKYKLDVSFLPSQKLSVKPEIFRNFFKPTIDALITHVDQLLKDAKLVDLRNIIMVGAFSECKLVIDAVKREFSRMLITIPPDAGLAVLKGAVLFGHQPKKITKRVLKKTYGIQSWPEWNSDIHPERKRVLIDGSERCKDVFFRFAHRGEKVEAGHSVSQVFEALKPDEKTLECTVYVTDDTNPKYVTDVGCKSLGNLIVPLPLLRLGETLEIEETMIFGGTEILFRARNLKTGAIYETRFEF